ncbi:MAG: hypothetical protein ABI910_10820 [Gemmatimonadota bacterium]
MTAPTLRMDLVPSQERDGNGMMQEAAPIGATVSSGGDPRRERLLVFALAAAVLLVAVLTITPWPVGAFQDDAIYTVLAKSLATGQGFRLINLPGAPHNTHYPPGYPLLLAGLWKLWPSFPDNIVLFKFVNAFFLAAAAVGSYVFSRERWRFAPWQAAVVAVVGTLSVVVLLVTGVVLSEPYFLALLLPTLLLTERAAERGDVRTAIIAGLLLGALSMVRTLGVFAVPAAGLVMLRRRHWRALFALGAAAALFLVPWQLWVAAHQGEVAHPLIGKYGSYGTWLVEGYRSGGWPFARAVLVHNAQDIDRTISYMLFPVQLAWPRAVALLGTLVFMIAGMKRYARNTPVTLGFLACYTFVIMVWPFEPNRFLIAVWPLWLPLVGYGIAACWQLRLPTLARLPWRALVLVVAGGISGGYLWYNGMGYRQKWWTAVQRNAGVRARPTAEWVEEHTAPNAIIATDDDLIIYLYTGRQSVPTSTFTASERVGPLSDTDVLTAVDEIFAAYEPDFFIVGSETGLRSARALMGRTPPLLQHVGSTPSMTIFQRPVR